MLSAPPPGYSAPAPVAPKSSLPGPASPATPGLSGVMSSLSASPLLKGGNMAVLLKLLKGGAK